MEKIVGYIIVGVILIVVLTVALAVLKVAVGVLFYLFIVMLILSGIIFLYNRFIKR